MTITRLLVANRGEIAGRVFATCRRLGIETVAVHSDADAALPFVADADFAVHLPGNTPAETYLRGELVIEAARTAGADAIHPGYGFLSENAGFARAVIDAGLTWVGPSPASIEAMGDKVRAKAMMAAAGVPVLEAPAVPGPADLPLLVKASAGGGGRGMRIVRDLAALPAEIEAASAEAASAFGDGTVFVEPYVEHARHVEVQVLGDPTGLVEVLGERDCSLQRRHQKVVEEAPAPGLSPDTRAALHAAARQAASAIGYLGAGTVEFLVDADHPERFWFLEMNTRLQVEHPVTECVTGLDLVDLQLAVAEGRSPGLDEPEVHGHAVEVRLYAEDPAQDWQPQSGRLLTFDFPGATSAFEVAAVRGIRVDAGFESGSEVSTHYDAMLAKVISWAPDRAQAVRQLVAALRRARIHGVTTNRDLLVASLADPSFASGQVSTDFFERTGTPSVGSGGDVRTALLAATAAIAEDARVRRTVQGGVPVAWRNVRSQSQVAEWLVGSDQRERVEWVGAGRWAGFPEDDFIVLDVLPIVGGYQVRYECAAVRGRKNVLIDDSRLPGTRETHVDGPDGYVQLIEVPRFTDPAAALASGSLLAPMPGTVVKVVAEVGQAVEAGDAVLVLEAMKMQHTVSAPTSGTVTEINVAAGAQVAAGEVLAVVSEEEQG